MKQLRVFVYIFLIVSTLLSSGAVVAQTAVSPQRPTRQAASAATTLVAKGAIWVYDDQGQAPADDGDSNSWRAPAYDDSGWAGSGAAPLGYADAHIVTTVSYGGDALDKHTTTYFRHSFNVADVSGITHLALNLLRDDGAVVYLNGTEVVRSNLAAGVVGYGTWAETAVSGSDETSYFSHSVDPSLLVDGSNTLAVELHQATANSSDLGFDLELVSSSGLVPFGATWNYLDNGSDQGTAWRNPAHDDSGWASGSAPLGYGDSGLSTTVGYGGDPNNKHITTYFRHSFTVADASTIPYLQFSFLRDDGIIIYLNGTEMVRNNMPGGSVDYQTTATSTVDNSAETTPVNITVAANSALVDGNNVLAVEIHQRNNSSSDIRFDLQLEAGSLSQFVQLLWSGGITSSSARVNAKLSIPSSTVRLVVSENADLSSPIFSPFVTASSANNNVAPLTVTGLTPNTSYYYAIEAEGVVDDSKIGQFHTFADGAFSYTFAMAGDATMGSSHPIYTSIRDQNPLFFLSPGDFFYADIGSNNRDLFRAAFDASLGAATQSALYQQVPIAYVWDDHDFGPNNSDGTSPSREAARLTYQEYVPHYPLGAGSGDVPIYQAFTVGRARFIMLDLRSERTPSGATDNASKTMMGAAQKAWFKQQLLDANGSYPLIFIVGSVPWISSSSSDTWAGYTTERQELADFIKDNDIRGLVMLSADAHMLALDDGTNNSYATGGGASFPVFHAAALDRGGSVKGGPYTHGPFTGAGQFALVTVTDNDSDQICVAYSGLRRDDTTGNLSELIDWTTCYYLTAVSPTVTPAINTTVATSLDLTWDTNPANCSYEIHSDTTPYFDPVPATLVSSTGGSSATVPLALGDPSENHFYWVRAVNCDASKTAVSNHIAEFDFPLVPGSP